MFYRGWIYPKSSKFTECFGGDSHWQSFEETRRKHTDNICNETNKLVLRLDKLINSVDNSPSSSSTTSELDKSIVEWTLNDLVKLCPYCAKSFTIARRRHHCRLCGAILCASCSRFLEHRAACKLVRPAKLYTDPYDRIADQLESKNSDEMPKVRSCEDCKRLLDKRIQTIEDYYCQPKFLEFYEKLRQTMSEADELMIAQSSAFSEPSHSTLNEKTNKLELKSKIQQLRHEVAVMSSRVNKLASNEPVGSKQAYLLKAIGSSIANWLKESIDNKISRINGNSGEQTSGRGGWVPDQPALSMSELSNCDDDPLLIQIKNLDEYIRQAKSADRYEEVAALEANKRDLEIEYFVQQAAASASSQTGGRFADDDVGAVEAAATAATSQAEAPQ